MGLAYDMGNAGDLLKHGVLAEFVRWQCEQGKSFRFIDLFGGEPWGLPSVEVVRRIQQLPEGLALKAAQPDIGKGRYYGSGYLVRNVAKNARGRDVRVFVNDINPEHRQQLRESGLPLLDEEFSLGTGLGQYDGYNVFEKIVPQIKEDDLVLIDPYAEFLSKKAEAVVPQIGKVIKCASVLLFALNQDPCNQCGRRFDALLKEHLPDAWRMTCPPLRDCQVRGESKYHAECVLAAYPFPEHKNDQDVTGLRKRLDTLAEHLADLLAQQLKPRVIDLE